MRTVTRHRMRLVERIIKEGTCGFLVEALTPALAAGILLTAHKRAFKPCGDLVTLLDARLDRVKPSVPRERPRAVRIHPHAMLFHGAVFCDGVPTPVMAR